MDNFFIFTWLKRLKWFLIWIQDYILYLHDLGKHLIFLIRYRLPLKVKIIKYSYLNKYYNQKALKEIRKKEIQKLFKEIIEIKKNERLSFYETIVLFKHYYNVRSLQKITWSKFTEIFSNFVFFFIYTPISFLYYTIWHSFCIIIIFPLWDLLLKIFFLVTYFVFIFPIIFVYGFFVQISQLLEKPLNQFCKFFRALFNNLSIASVFVFKSIILIVTKVFKLFFIFLKKVLRIILIKINKFWNLIITKIISIICMNFFSNYYTVWVFLKKNFENKLNSSVLLDREKLRYKKSELNLPFWYEYALRWFIYKNYFIYTYKTKVSFYIYKYLSFFGKNKNDQWFSFIRLYYLILLKIKGIKQKSYHLLSLLSFNNLSYILYKLISYISFPKNISKVMFFELFFKLSMIWPWYHFFFKDYNFYHSAPYTFLKAADGTQVMNPALMSDTLHWLVWQGDNEEQAYLELAENIVGFEQQYLKFWACDEFLYKIDPFLPFSFITQIFFISIWSLIFFTRYWRTLFFPFLPQIFVDKNKWFKEDPFDRLQELKNQLFKTNYKINYNLKKFIDESTIDITTISLKEFINKRFSFSQLWDLHNELHTYVLEGRLELKNNIYYQNFFKEYDLAISKYDKSWLNSIHIKYDQKITNILCEYDYVERAFLNVNRLLLQTNISNLSSIKKCSRKHLRPFFLDSLLKYEDDKVFYEKIYKDDLNFIINKFRYKNQYLIKELTNRYYSKYNEYLPFTVSSLGDWVWNLPLNALKAKLSLNNTKTSYIHQSLKQHIYLDDETIEINNFITHYDNWVEAHDEEMDPDAEWYNTFVDPNIPTALSEELEELELPSPSEYDLLMKEMFWKNFNIFSLFSNFKNYLEKNYGYNFVKNHFQNTTDLNWLTNRQIDFLNHYYKTTDYYKNLPRDTRWQKERKIRINNLVDLFNIVKREKSYKDFTLIDWNTFNNFNFWLKDDTITKKVLFRPEPHKYLTRFGLEEVNIIVLWISFFVVPYLFFWKNGMWYLLAHSYVDMIWYWWDESFIYSKYVHQGNLGGLIEETNDDSFERFYPFWNFPVENRIHNDMIHKPASFLHDTVATYWSMFSNWFSCWYMYLQVLAEKRIMYHLFELEENNRKTVFEGYTFIAEKGPALDVPFLENKRPFMWSWNKGIYDKYIEYYETEKYDLLFINIFKHLLVEIKQYIKYVRSLWVHKFELCSTNIQKFTSYYLGDNLIYNFYIKLKYAYELRYYRYLTDNTYRYCSSNNWWLFPAKDFSNNMAEVKNMFFFKLFQYDPAQLNEKIIFWKLKPIYTTKPLNGISNNEIKQHEYFLNGLYVFLWWSIIIIPYIYWLLFSDWVQTNRYRYIIKRFITNPNEHWMLYMDDLWIDYNEWDLANSATYDPYAFLALERNGELRSFLDLNPYLGSRFHYSWHPLRLLRCDLANKAINNMEEKLNFLNNVNSFLKNEDSLYTNLLLNKSMLKRNLITFEKEYQEQINLLNPGLVDYNCFNEYYQMTAQVNKQYIKDIAWKQRLYRLKLYLYKKNLKP